MINLLYVMCRRYEPGLCCILFERFYCLYNFEISHSSILLPESEESEDDTELEEDEDEEDDEDDEDEEDCEEACGRVLNPGLENVGGEEGRDCSEGTVNGGRSLNDS